MNESEETENQNSIREEATALWREIDEVRAKIEQKLIVLLERSDVPKEVKELFQRLT